jgi:quaternary ammonium compound-resistance protein SugE
MFQSSIGWICLAAAGISQMGWTYSLKVMQNASIDSLRWSNLLHRTEGRLLVAALFGYIALGALNSALLSIAMRSIPTTTAFAVWMSLSLVFLKLGDIIWFKQSWSALELFFLLLILAGIVGLKTITANE